MKTVSLRNAKFLHICALACCLCFAYEMKAQTTIVAYVNGVAILDKDISVKSEGVEKLFVVEHGRPPSQKELTIALIATKRRNLTKKVENLIRTKVMDELNIKVSKEELEAEMRKEDPLTIENPVAALNKQQIIYGSLVRALRRVTKDPKKEEVIYTEIMKDLMDHDSWLLYVKCYNSEERITEIEKAIPKNVNDIYNSTSKGVYDHIARGKLRAVITRDVTIGEEEVSKEILTRNGDTNNVQIRTEIKKRIMNIKQDAVEHAWWDNQYEKNKIEMTCKTFMEVVRN